MDAFLDALLSHASFSGCIVFTRGCVFLLANAFFTHGWRSLENGRLASTEGPRRHSTVSGTPVSHAVSKLAGYTKPELQFPIEHSDDFGQGRVLTTIPILLRRWKK